MSFINDFLNKKGYKDVIDLNMQSHISLWRNWWHGKVESFHTYDVYNGTKQVRCERYSMQLAKSVCETWASLLFNEKCSIVIEDEETNIFVNNIIDNLKSKINEAQELKSVYGTILYIPFVQNLSLENDNLKASEETTINIDVVTADMIYPLTVIGGELIECAVVSSDNEYTWIQMFILDENNQYVVENYVFNGSAEVFDFTSIPKYSRLLKSYKTNSSLKPFVVDRLATLNNINKDSALGISVFANAIDSIKICDLTFDSMKNEIQMGKRRIMVKSEGMSLDNNGKPTFDPNDVVFHTLPAGISNDEVPFIKEIDIKIRSREHIEVLNNSLSIFSSQCGLGENYYKFDGSSIATATQVISDNSTLFRTLKKHEKHLESALKSLCKLLIEMGIKLFNLNLDIESKITINFDDSIIEDTDTKRARDLEAVKNNLMSKTSFMCKWLNLSEEEAQKELEKIRKENISNINVNEVNNNNVI